MQNLVDPNQLTVIVKIDVKEGKVQRFKELMSLHIPLTRKEPGCILFELKVNQDNPNQFWLLEKWKNLNALKYHYQTKHFKKYFPLLNELRNNTLVRARSCL